LADRFETPRIRRLACPRRNLPVQNRLAPLPQESIDWQGEIDFLSFGRSWSMIASRLSRSG
jgi:hypothetical protein